MLKLNLKFARVGIIIMACSLTQCANVLFNSQMQDSVCGKASREEELEEKKIDYIDIENSRMFGFSFPEFVKAKKTFIEEEALKKCFSVIYNTIFVNLFTTQSWNSIKKELLKCEKNLYVVCLNDFYKRSTNYNELEEVCGLLNCTVSIYYYWGLEVERNQIEWKNFIGLFDTQDLREEVKWFLTKVVTKIIMDSKTSYYFAPSFQLLYETFKHTKRLGKNASIISLGSGDGGFELLHWFVNSDALIVLVDSDAKALTAASDEHKILEKFLGKKLRFKPIQTDLHKNFNCGEEDHRAWLARMGNVKVEDKQFTDIKFSILMINNYLSLQVNNILKNTFGNLKLFSEMRLIPGGLFTMINDGKAERIDESPLVLKTYGMQGKSRRIVEKCYFVHYDDFKDEKEIHLRYDDYLGKGLTIGATVLFGLGSSLLILNSEEYRILEEIRSRYFNYPIAPTGRDLSNVFCCIETIAEKRDK